MKTCSGSLWCPSAPSPPAGAWRGWVCLKGGLKGGLRWREGGGGEGGYVVLFGRFVPFSDHFKSKNLTFEWFFVLCFTVFRFLASSFLLF